MGKYRTKISSPVYFLSTGIDQSGFDHYKIIDVRFAGQVVGGKSENPKIDSVKLAKSVEQMLQRSK